MDKINECIKPPKDRWKIVFFIFLLHGLGTLMPWNMFITAKSYFVDFKLVSNEGNVTSVYANNFMQYMGFASQIPNLVFNWLNIFVHLGGDLTKRIVYTMLILLICFDTYFALPLNRFYRYHELRRLKEEKPLCSAGETRVPYLKIFKEAFPQLFNIFFTFFVTLAISNHTPMIFSFQKNVLHPLHVS
ncbi:Equilibrative nucleoside transporter 1 [Lucilia cuprina]|nr:Equilibrative nucleoside transporter 1 [Lucilia cuprina]